MNKITQRYLEHSYEFGAIMRAISARDYSPVVILDGERWKVLKVEFVAPANDEQYIDVTMIPVTESIYMSTPS